MKTALQKFWIAILAVVSFVACESKETMTPEEAAGWVAAYSPERIDIDATIRIEATKTLFEHIDTLRSLDNVFRFTPSVKGSAHYVNGGKVIEFIPEQGGLELGEQYNCRVGISSLTGIDSLKDFSFYFVVERREAQLTDLHVSIDPDNVEQVIVTGKMLFSSEPGEQSTDASFLDCNVNDAKSAIRTTDEKSCYAFTITSIKRKSDDFIMQIKYNPRGEFSMATSSVVIPGLSEFKLLSAKRCEAVQPYINLEFSAPLASEQELDGLITIDDVDAVRIERRGTNVKVYYPVNGLTDIVLRVSELIRTNDGRTLQGDIEQHFEQKVIAPAIEIPISGTILPDGSNLTFPFRAVNLVAVDVEVIKIYTDNVLTFLQENEINATYGLRRVGRLIYKQTVRLDKDEKLNLHQWQNFSIDLKNLFRQERGAIYNIRLSFRKAYSLYDKVKIGEIDINSGLTRSDRDEWDKKYADINRMPADYDWYNYNWRERDDPSKESYYMTMDHMPEYNLMASDLGLIVKRADSDKLWCTVSNLMTANAMSGVRVIAYNYQMREIGSAYTDEKGFADFIVDGNPFVVTASNGVSKTYLKINGGHELSTSCFDVGGKNIPQGIKGFVYGERGVWRPGDDIYLTLIVEDKQKALPKNHPVIMELYTPEGQLYDRQTLTQSVDGIYVFQTATTDDAPTGSWDACFKVGGQTFHYTVRVETIKPNRLKINISSPEVLYSGKPENIGIEAHWLTGPVAAGLKVNVEMLFYNNPQPFERYNDYLFSNPLYTNSHSKQNVLSCQLDSLGKCSNAYFLPIAENAPGMMQANLIARVAEAGGDESLTSRSVRYSPYVSYVGVNLQDREFETDCDLHFPVITLDAEGRFIERNLTYKIYHLNWSWWWEGSANDLNKYVQSTTAEVVASGRVVTTQGKGEITFRVDYPSWGKYLIYVKDSISTHASGGVVYIDRLDWRGHSAKSDPTAATMLSFSLDKRNYEVGEYATVYFPKSADSRVLLSIENGSHVLSREWVRTSSKEETAHRILITKEMAPNFYIHASLLQPHAQTANDLPIRMYGVEGAEVVDRRTILHPVIEVADEILPQQEFLIKVREQDDKPMSYTLAIVDEGLLDITAFKTPQPWPAMNECEALGVKTWDMYEDVIGAYAGKFTSILSIGGDEALRRAVGKEKRFNPVVKFLGPFTLNKGTKTHKITLPMYVGSVRVMIVAAKNGSYGNADKTVTVRSPLMLLTTMPRQLACGNRINVPINLFALEEGVKDVQVTMNVEGPLSVVGEESKQVTFTRPSEKLVNFELVCDDVRSGQAKIEITAVGGGQNAMETIYIDIANPLPDVIASQSVTLEGGEKYRFDCSDFKSGEAQLTLATMPTIDFGGAFSFVENYSHYCTEQLSARALYMLDARKFLGVEEQKCAEKALSSLLKTITSRQLSSGGFAYWPGNNEAHDWVTSMVGEVLTEARRQGFAVSTQCYDRWKEYQNVSARRYRHTITHAKDLKQAYRLYTLVLAGEQPTAAMNKFRESKSISRQALLRLAATYSLVGRSDIATKLLEKYDATPIVNGTYETFWSTLRDEAMALEAWLLVGDKVKAFEVAQDIANNFSAIYSSTQEVAFVCIAMSRMGDMVGNSSSQVAITEGDESTKIIRNLRGVQQFDLTPANGFIEVENQGEEAVSLSLMLKRKPYATEVVKPDAKGVEIDVQYTDLVGNAISIDKLRQGQEFLAKIKVNMKANNTQSMALTYTVPSGWEIWNERLVGGNADAVATYIDVRDDRICWYFSGESGKSKCFTVRLRAAYTGVFVLPPTICEDMYNPACRANTPNSKTSVVQ